MADDDANNAQAHRQALEPNPALGSLDVMVGTWDLKGLESGPDGEKRGRVTFEWMEGGFYLVQRVDMDYLGRKIMPTLVIAGGASFPFMRVTAQALADILPDGRTRTLEGQEHNVDSAAIAPVLREFFAG